MIQIHTLVLGELQTNCYVAEGPEGRCVILDPAGEAHKVLEHLGRKKLTAEAILLTHGHFDHVGAVMELVAELEIPVYLCPGDKALPAFLTRPVGPTTEVTEGMVLELAGLRIQVLHTPGHTPGSVCYQVEDVLFTGDTLFDGSCGRVDLPGGEPKEMLKSLKRLKDMDFCGTIYPGHGPSSTMSLQRIINPYLLGVVDL